jgi:hypothetical protein
MNDETVDVAAKVKAAIFSILNQLNVLGSILLAYALANPNAFAELKGMLPASAQPYAPLLALIWFGVVQLAKMNAIKKAAQA